MPEMTKGNAREIMTRTLERFKTLTGEAVGVTYSWKGGLNVLGPECFKTFIGANKEEVWRTLAYTRREDYSISKPALDQEMKSWQDNYMDQNVATLRKLVSWILQQTLGNN